MSYKLVFTKKALIDAEKLKNSGLKENTIELLEIIRKNPFENTPYYEKLVGELTGTYSRRINVKHRLVYQVIQEEKIVKVLRMWSHYE